MTTTLADLRRASLAEQKAETAATSEAAISPEDPARPASVNPETRKSVDTPSRPAVRTEARKAVSKQARKQVYAQVRTDASAGFLERVRTAIGEKKTHPGGVKATVDMPPELSLRAKRFCLDHNNVPVRQVFLELMDAFLTEEGY